MSIILIPFVFITIILVMPFYFLCDKGPIFYNALRIGKDGKPFKMFKLRTMIVNSPDIRLKDGSTYNSDDDPRITKLGRFLRKTSIDELPQIFNVLIGDMSFIGPRPDPLDWMEKYSEEQKFFLTVRPGISGYNQAYFRNSVNGIEKMKNDLYYARNISFILDFQIFFKTIKTILFKENINVSEDRK